MPSIDGANEGGASTISSAVSLLKTIIGAGLLSMPLAYSTDGTILGTVIILVAAITSGFGLFLQCYVSKYTTIGHATFFGLCSITYPQLSVVFDIAIAVQCFGCAVSYLVLIRDLMPTIVSHIPYVDQRYYKLFWLLVSTLFTVPLSFLKNLDSLKYTSILGLVAIGYISVLVITHWLIGDIPRTGIIEYFPSSATKVFSTFSIIVFAFTGQQNMFSIINEARDKSLPKLAHLVDFAIILATLLFVVVGLTGYLTFGANVNGNVILSYPNGWTTTLGRACVVFLVVFSFPLMLHPARISVNNIWYELRAKFTKLKAKEEEENAETNENTQLLSEPATNDQEVQSKHRIVPFPQWTFTTITVVLLVLGYTLAIAVKSFAFVLAIVGATGSTSISFILPALFGYKLIGSESDDPTKLERILKGLSLALAIWGVTVMFVCLYSSLAL
ncbi:uncharacterized protein LODBEIA_P46510 [Lodderomyces beijingensis]|uniref:Amino acid transporter transmembrane domain-containing protein n=1 Tax=Lodderomyces beijingensis TaxID=1775926 RepID=A0ABP0ZVD3_9ASCO